MTSMTSLNKDKRVKVSWIDIVSNPEWVDSEKVKKQSYSKCESIGYLLHKEKDKVIIYPCHSFDEDGEMEIGNYTIFPRCVVKKIEVIK